MGAGFFDTALAQRACRSFTEEVVPDADLGRMLEAAVHAPSAQNSQPWVFVVVRDPGVRSALSDLTRRLWGQGARDAASREVAPGLLRDVDRSVERGFGGAPVLVVVGADTARVPLRIAGSSVFPAVQNLLLAANALGYGSALTTLTVQLADDTRQVLGLPDSVTPLAVVPIGKPAGPLTPPRREPVTSKTHRDLYGRPWDPKPGPARETDIR